MRSAIHLLLVSSLLGCATARMPDATHRPVQGQNANAADSAGAHAATVAFITAFDSLQWEPFRAYLAEDITMFFPFPQVPGRVDGRDAVERIFGQFMRSQRDGRARDGLPMVQGLILRDLRIQMAGADAAVATFHLGSTESPSRRSLIFRRTAAGEWKVIHWHASPSPQRSAN